MKRALALFLLATIAGSTWAQKKPGKNIPVKRPLTHDVYDRWKEIPFKEISNDGNVAALVINPQDGDGKVVFYNSLKPGSQDSAGRASDIALTFDSRFAVFKIKPQQQVIKDLRRQKKKKEDLPKDSLGIYSVSSRKTEKIPNVRSYKIPEKSGGWVAFMLEAKKEEKPRPAIKPDSVKKDSVKIKKESPAKKKIKKNTDDNGYTLTLRRLESGKETLFGFVKDYQFAKYGQGLLFTSTGNDSTLKAGVYWYDLADEKLLALYTGKAKQKIKALSIAEDGAQVSFILDADTTKALQRFPKLYYWKKGQASAAIIADETKLISSAQIVSEHYTPVFSKDGSKLFFGVSPQPIVQDTTLLPEEIVNVEVWNWQDDHIYPQQNKEIDRKKKQSHRAVMHLSTQQLVVLGNEEIPNVELADEGNASIALGSSDIPYRKSATWDGRGQEDVYVLDVKTGDKKKIATGLKGNALISPKATYVYWFSLPDTAWFSYAVNESAAKKLTRGMKIKFADEEDDHPDYPSPYGSAGWVGQDERLLVYDRYDIWSLDPSGKNPAVNLTRIGRTQKIIFRNIRLDYEQRFFLPDQELLLSAFNETTKASGFYKLSLKTGALTKLISSDHQYAFATKAKESDKVLFTRASFTEYPDVWIADFNFTSPRKLTEANPQMKNYLCGEAWRSSVGPHSIIFRCRDCCTNRRISIRRKNIR